MALGLENDCGPEGWLASCASSGQTSAALSRPLAPSSPSQTGKISVDGWMYLAFEWKCGACFPPEGLGQGSWRLPEPGGLDCAMVRANPIPEPRPGTERLPCPPPPPFSEIINDRTHVFGPFKRKLTPRPSHAPGAPSVTQTATHIGDLGTWITQCPAVCRPPPGETQAAGSLRAERLGRARERWCGCCGMPRAQAASLR